MTISVVGLMLPRTYLWHEMQGTQVSDRFLRERSFPNANSPVLIAWYCFLSTVICPVLFCMGWCWYQKLIAHRRALSALQHERQLEQMSQIEANVQLFSDAEKARRIRLVSAAVKDNTRILSAEDLLLPAGTAGIATSTDTQRERKGSTDTAATISCGICLEDFAVGDVAAHSPNSCCHHLFHQDCIVSWLVARQHALCPFCRLPFICQPLLESSRESMIPRDERSTTADETGSS